MARKVIFKDDGINNLPDAPAGYKFIGYDGQVVSQKSGATVSAISGGLVSNFATDDLTFTANRTHDLGGYSLTLTNGELYTSRYIKYDTAPLSFIDFGYNGGIALIDDSIASIISPTIAINAEIDTYIKLDATGRKVNLKGDLFNYTITQDGIGEVFKIIPSGSSAISTLKGTVKTISPGATSGDTAFSVRNNTDTADLIVMQGHGALNHGGYTAFDTQSVIRNTSGFFYVFRCLDMSENILFNVSRTEINLNLATGFGGSAESGVKAKFHGTVKTISPSASSLDTAFTVRNNTDSAHLVHVKGDGETVFSNVVTALAVQSNFHRSADGVNLLTWDGLSARLPVQTIFPSRILNSPVTTTDWRSSDDTIQVMRIYDSGNIKVGNVVGTSNAKFEVVSPSASSLDTAFSVRNSADTTDMFQVKGNGDIEQLTGFQSIGTGINTNAKFNVYTPTVDAAIRGYSDTVGGKAILAQADGVGAIGIQSVAQNVGGGTGARLTGSTNALLFNGGFFDDAQNTTPTFPQTTIAGEVAFLATISVGKWYYLDNGDGTGTVKVKL